MIGSKKACSVLKNIKEGFLFRTTMNEKIVDATVQ